MKKEYTLDFDNKVISKEALLQVMSIYKGKADFELTLKDTNEYQLKVIEIGEEELSQKLRQDILDQQVRIDLEKEFGSLRADIVRYAFSSAENINE